MLHLVDARHPALDSDADAHDWLSRTGVAIAVVATKIDKLTQSEQKKHLKLLAGAYDTLILPASVLKNIGLDEIWKVIRGWTNAPGSSARTASGRP